MGFNVRRVGEQIPAGRRTARQLAEQVVPLAGQLAVGDRQPQGVVARSDFGAVEPIPTPSGFCQHAPQVAVDRRDRIRTAPETVELGMAAVSDRRAREHGTGQKPLAPAGYQPRGIQITRMERPQTHGTDSPATRRAADLRRAETANGPAFYFLT